MHRFQVHCPERPRPCSVQFLLFELHELDHAIRRDISICLHLCLRFPFALFLSLSFSFSSLHFPPFFFLFQSLFGISLCLCLSLHFTLFPLLSLSSIQFFLLSRQFWCHHLLIGWRPQSGNGQDLSAKLKIRTRRSHTVYRPNRIISLIVSVSTASRSPSTSLLPVLDRIMVHFIFCSFETFGKIQVSLE